jgi:hypothetical protein
MKGQHRRSAAVAGAEKANLDRGGCDLHEFHIAAVGGEHRPDAGKRGLHPLAKTGLDDAVTAQHRVDDLVGEGALHGRERRAIGLQGAHQPLQRLAVQRLDRTPIGLHRVAGRAFPACEDRFEPFDVPQNTGEVGLLLRDDVDGVHRVLSGNEDP